MSLTVTPRYFAVTGCQFPGSSTLMSFSIGRRLTIPSLREKRSPAFRNRPSNTVAHSSAPLPCQRPKLNIQDLCQHRMQPSFLRMQSVSFGPPVSPLCDPFPAPQPVQPNGLRHDLRQCLPQGHSCSWRPAVPEIFFRRTYPVRIVPSSSRRMPQSHKP